MQYIVHLRDSGPPIQNRQTAWETDRIEDRELSMISDGFRCHGGVATAEEVVRLMRRRCNQPISTLARWIVERNVVRFSLRGATLLPLFQFDSQRMLPDPTVINVMRELREAYGDWEIALWFVTPNARTNGIAPVEAFDSDPLVTLAAARNDRRRALGLAGS